MAFMPFMFILNEIMEIREAPLLQLSLAKFHSPMHQLPDMFRIEGGANRRDDGRLQPL
jgi:hypothetical protein